MTISVVTYRKGGTQDVITAAARKGKAVFQKHGAAAFIASQVLVGPDAGQWAIVIAFANWEAFGDAMQGATNDPMFHEFVAAMDAVSETVNRRILTSLDL
jgi:hypothetical protein